MIKIILNSQCIRQNIMFKDKPYLTTELGSLSRLLCIPAVAVKVGSGIPVWYHKVLCIPAVALKVLRGIPVWYHKVLCIPAVALKVRRGIPVWYNKVA